MKLKKLLKHFEDRKKEILIHLSTDSNELDNCYINNITDVKVMKKYLNCDVVNWTISSRLIHDVTDFSCKVNTTLYVDISYKEQ